MDQGDLNDIQRAILKQVHDDDGRTPTEGIYDIVEAKRPTVDDEGEPLDPDVDIYETSREELGALERGGLLEADYNTNWVMGASVFTAKGREVADELFGEGERLEGERRQWNDLKRRLTAL